MPPISVQAVFVVVVLVSATTVMAADEEVTGEVSFWKKTVTVVCPGSKVYDGDGKNELHDTNKYEFEYKRQVKLMCKEKTPVPYLIYVKGRACENCFELNGAFILSVLMVDLFGTAVVMMIIYKCSKKQSIDIPSKPTKTTPKTGRAPPVPSPDYESLNVHTLSSGTYSTMNNGLVNRTG